jgi:hypothetical protein
MICKISKLFIFCLLSLFAFSSLSAAAFPEDDSSDNDIYFPLYQDNDTLPWQGKAFPVDEVSANDGIYFPLYHDNGIIAWRGLNSTNKEINYDNSKIAWKGNFKKEGYYEALCSIFHRNGKVAWKGWPKNDGYYESLCSIYHNNEKVAWRGWLKKDGYYESLCSLYHNNGKEAWRGWQNKDGYYESLCSFYHDNGKVAWGGWLKKNGYYESLCSLYHDNGKMAWGGRAGDPLYDENGKLIRTNVNAVNIELGNGSWLYLNSSSIWNLYLCIGDGNYLIFSSEDDNPRLLISLGSNYSLYLFPYSGDKALFLIDNTAIEIK